MWSRPAALRAVRAAIVVPCVFAFADKVLDNLQLATFAAFGGFATLVLVSFGGTRREKLMAHLSLALAGSALIAVGTAVSSTTWVAVLVTVPVVFTVFFAGVCGPNAAAGVNGALLAYVLPAASKGTVSMIPERLGGWWLASVAGTIAVMCLSPPVPGDRLRPAAARVAAALAEVIDRALGGRPAISALQAAIDAKHELLEAFTATPYRPIGASAPGRGAVERDRPARVVHGARRRHGPRARGPQRRPRGRARVARVRRRDAPGSGSPDGAPPRPRSSSASSRMPAGAATRVCTSCPARARPSTRPTPASSSTPT